MSRAAVIAAAVLACATTAAQAQAPPLWPEVAGLLQERCSHCHFGAFAPLGLDLTSHAGLMAGSWNGPVVDLGAPDQSMILRRLRGQATPQMPLDGPPFLAEGEIAIIAAWIAAGAPEDGTAPEPDAPPEDDGVVTFADVAPIFDQRCIVCHSDNSRLGGPPEGLRLIDLANVLAGGERLVVVPGNPVASPLWRHITGRASPRMPFDGPPWLTEEQIALIETWIVEGALDDDGNPAPIPVGGALRIRAPMSGAREIGGAAFTLTPETRLEERPPIGAPAELRAEIGPDGALIATRLRAR